MPKRSKWFRRKSRDNLQFKDKDIVTGKELVERNVEMVMNYLRGMDVKEITRKYDITSQRFYKIRDFYTEEVKPDENKIQ